MTPELSHVMHPATPNLPGGGLVSCLHGTSDILGSALSHVTMETAL